MKWREFEVQISRLINTYGRESYPDNCVSALFDCLEHVSIERFTAAITRVLAINVNPRFPPGLDKIEKQLCDIIIEAHEETKEVRKTKGPKKAKPEHVSKYFSEVLKGLTKTQLKLVDDN